MSNISKVSIVLNIHREGVLLPSTLTSLDKATGFAIDNGCDVELVCVQNSSDVETVHIFSHFLFNKIKKIIVVKTENLSLGDARNVGISHAKGDYIWTADGDDLVSETSLWKFVAFAQNLKTDRFALFPEFLIEFGNSSNIFKYPTEKDISVFDFLFNNPFVSRIFAPRSMFIENPYKNLQKSKRFAFEDWDLNNRLKVAGCLMTAVPDTILFYRKRQGNLLSKIVTQSANLVDNSAIYKPETLKIIVQKESKIDHLLMLRGRKRPPSCELVDENNIREIKEVIKITPEILWPHLDVSSCHSSVSTSNYIKGKSLYNFYRLCQGSYTDIVILPSLAKGGGEKYILDVLDRIAHYQTTANFLVLCCEKSRNHSWRDRLPKNCTFIDVYNSFPRLSTLDLVDVVARGIINLSGKEARLHLKASCFAHELFNKYNSILSQYFRVYYYRFSDDLVQFLSETFDSPWSVFFLRNNIDYIDYIVSDNSAVQKKDIERYGVTEPFVKLPNLCKIVAKEGSAELKHRFLWASRLSREKRVGVLLELGRLIERKKLPVKIDVFGTLTNAILPILEQIEKSSVLEYKGAFDGFSFVAENYDGLLYTSTNDGTPNIVLEAMKSGFCVIAPSVGGIPDVVINEKTGFLLPNKASDFEMASLYLERVEWILQNKLLSTEIAKSGSDFIADNYGFASYDRVIKEFFLNGSKRVNVQTIFYS